MPLIDLTHRLTLIELEMKKIKDSLVDSPAVSYEEYLKRVYLYNGMAQAKKTFSQRSAAEDGE